MRCLPVLLIAGSLYGFTPVSTSAQGLVERAIGPDASGNPVVFHAFTMQELGVLARAAGVPIGFEPLPRPRKPDAREPVVLTGRTVGEALELMIARDPRYAWREEEGVLLIESADVAAARAEGRPITHPLDAPAPAVRLGETSARAAFAVVVELLGAPKSTAIAFSDTKPFVLDAPEGSIRSLLNAIVRSHGQLVWVFQRDTSRTAMFPYTVLLMSGADGWGLGVSGVRTFDPLDATRFGRNDERTSNIVDAIVGTRGDGYPLVMTSMASSSPGDLAIAAHVVIGMEVAPGRPPGYVMHAPEFTATGRTLREVLDILVARDNRYEWRVADNTVIIRPVTAWSNSEDPLFSLVPDVQLENVSMTEALRAVVSALAGADSKYMTFPDSKSVSLSVWHGTALDLLVALGKAHGSLVWTFTEADPEEIRTTGMRHRLTIGVAGGVGTGVLVR